MPSRSIPGPHELGQNFLTDPAVAREVVSLIADQSRRPLVEWAAGNGALTRPLARLGRPLEAVEIDARRVTQLRRDLGAHVAVVAGDILRHAPPEEDYDLVCNVPFHITTPVLRRLLALPRWRRAVLITQWDVARKRAGVGGATQLTAQWWPWYEFRLRRRIPASSFTPRPTVDAGLLLVERRPVPLVATRSDYQRFVRDVFTGRGRGLRQILLRTGRVRAAAADAWLRRNRLPAHALPRDLDATQWASLYELTTSRSTARRRR